ncbi:MAG: multidrug ABC transporter ATP-binding protein [candidate division Zixibacteria bacterium SM1_73]|nr:MAG: multidrug ABC transporter ATP-binding protein [candidate division Zixibacteria bacterium SM1_73]
MELSINNLSKTYANGVVALDDVSLDIPTGLFGLLGPNGAGKSTLMRTIATLQEADSGEISFEGIDVLRQKSEVKKVLGYLPQNFGFYPKDTGYNLLDHFTLLKGVRDKKERKAKVEELLKRVNLWNERKQKLGTYSNGMRQRFGIAQALIGNPKLIIVDEPTAGLDPEERVRFHNLLSEIGENIVVILSTHIVDDVSDLCMNMAIIDKGRIILKENTLDAMSQLKGKIWEKEIPKGELPKHEEKYDVISTRLFAGTTFIRIYSETNPENGFSNIKPSVEDVYFYHLSQAN